jgi:membrane protease YdiL (CAAX protease family)
MTSRARISSPGRADALFIAIACGVVPLVSLAIVVRAPEAIAHANLAAYVASIVKWTALGGVALVLGRRSGMSWDELYLDPRDAFIVRRPASTCAVVVLFIAVVNVGVLPRFTAVWDALGLAHERASYLAMPASALGRVLGVVCALAAAAGSEVLYRGYLRVVAERYFRTWWTAALLVSAVFGWAHGFYGWYGAFYTGLNGLAFALLARATGSLYVVILAHLCFDALVFAAL